MNLLNLVSLFAMEEVAENKSRRKGICHHLEVWLDMSYVIPK